MTTTLEPFQQATVDAALNALGRPSGPRRYLIADEVGLGKTVVAAEITSRLHLPGQSLNVFYLCPNLDIATQNREKFSKTDIGDARPVWTPPEDRLSLCLVAGRAQRGVRRIYSLTPDTSLPSWKPGARTGRRAERDLIAALLRHRWPALWRRLHALDLARNAARPVFSSTRIDTAGLEGPFEAALRDIFQLGRRHLEPALIAWLNDRQLHGKEDGLAELVLRSRCALALAALRSAAVKPDLIVLDEFHRYADLILPCADAPAGETRRQAERRRIHALLMTELLGCGEHDGRRPPAVLLLSATPYRLRRHDGSEVGDGQRYESFSKLVDFLAGDSAPADVGRTRLLIRQHHLALTSTDDADPATAVAEVVAAKAALEAALHPVMARTERALASPDALFTSTRIPVQVAAQDLILFRHMLKAVDNSNARHLRHWTVPLWSSVPYPAQTLFGYGISPALEKAPLPEVTIDSSRSAVAHPQLRAFFGQDKTAVRPIRQEMLKLPWIPPTLTWWKLAGAWRGHGVDSGKALLFSRFRGAPGAISALLSLSVEDPEASGAGSQAKRFTAQAYLRIKKESPHATIALFMPWPTLARAIDPIKCQDFTLSRVRRAAVAELRRWLKVHGVEIGGTDRRPVWKVAMGLEIHLKAGGLVARAMAKQASLKEARKTWLAQPAVARVSATEVEAVAEHLLSAPGAVVARALARYEPDLPRDQVESVFHFCWRKLRPYLGQRYFAAAILGRKAGIRLADGPAERYPQALANAILEGGFEAVLDEHLGVLRLISNLQGPKLIEALTAGVLERPGSVRLRSGGVRKTRVRVHAVSPFAGAERRAARGGGDEKLRSDTLRRAFNSPFWPHVLTTTSVGQEGLDFHVWCDRVIHWDLPTDPVDFEQREGRVARYASLVVRRALVEEHGQAALAGPPMESPFARVIDRARAMPAAGAGLEKWWVPTSHKPLSITFDWAFSIRAIQFETLRRDLLFYRLALGQPEPELFRSFVSHFQLDAAGARELALNLSPLHPTFERSASA